MIEFLPNKTVAITMKDNYYLEGFIRALLNSGYTISQSESTKDECVKILISDNNKKQNDDNASELC